MEFLKNISEKMKADKKFKLAVYALVALGAVMICLNLFNPISKSNESSNLDMSVSYTEVEIKLEKILSTIDKVGKVNVMVSTKKENGNEYICGVIVTAEGARDIGVKLKLHDAVCTALNLEKENVEIFEMKEVEK